MREINSPDDFKFLITNIGRLLTNPLATQMYGVPCLWSDIHSRSSYLPNSSKQVKNPQEVLMLLWKLLLENRAFLIWIVRHDDINRILVPLLHYLYEGRKVRLPYHQARSYR